jgi:hypothetical protein
VARDRVRVVQRGTRDRADDGDPREQMLRRYVLTEQEQALLQRGSGSARLLFEASPWYRWSKEMFLRGRERCACAARDGAIATPFTCDADDASRFPRRPSST